MCLYSFCEAGKEAAVAAAGELRACALSQPAESAGCEQQLASAAMQAAANAPPSRHTSLRGTHPSRQLAPPNSPPCCSTPRGCRQWSAPSAGRARAQINRCGQHLMHLPARHRFVCCTQSGGAGPLPPEVLHQQQVPPAAIPPALTRSPTNAPTMMVATYTLFRLTNTCSNRCRDAVVSRARQPAAPRCRRRRWAGPTAGAPYGRPKPPATIAVTDAGLRPPAGAAGSEAPVFASAAAPLAASHVVERVGEAHGGLCRCRNR